MKAISITEVLALPIADRLKLVETIWDSIAEAPEALQLTPAQEAELDRRLETFRKNPMAGSSWPAVRARILKQALRAANRPTRSGDGHWQDPAWYESQQIGLGGRFCDVFRTRCTSFKVWIASRSLR